MRFSFTCTFTLISATLLAACGGNGVGDSSGIDRSRTVDSLSDDERMDLCEFGIAASGGEGAEFECPDDVTVTTGTVASCLADLDNQGSCTVGVLEDCATREDPCDISACLPVLDCAN